jgi:PTS system beta-glucosides-specific IIC component
MNYKQLGLEILAQVGGKGNVSKLTWCAADPRLREKSAANGNVER